MNVNNYIYNVNFILSGLQPKESKAETNLGTHSRTEKNTIQTLKNALAFLSRDFDSASAEPEDKQEALNQLNEFKKIVGSQAELYPNKDVTQLQQQVCEKIDRVAQIIRGEKPKIEEVKTEKQEVKESKPIIIPLHFSADQEPNKALKAQAEVIVSTCQKGAQNLVQGELDFPTIQILKENKKQAKELLKSPVISSSTKQAMEEVIKQYDYIVDSTEVLTFLRQMSREIRKPELEQIGDYTSKKQNTLQEFRSILDPFEGKQYSHNIYLPDHYDDLYQNDKEKWQKRWNAAREKMWNVSIEAKTFLDQKKKIVWITGSKSSTVHAIQKLPQLVPSLSSKPALIPTGQLLKHRIVPLAGELEMGVSDTGINQSALSGMLWGKGLHVCMSYATNEGFVFDAEKEIKRFNHIYQYLDTSNESILGYIVSQCQIASLRLLLMGAKQEIYPSLLERMWELRQLLGSTKNMKVKAYCEKLTEIIRYFDEIKPLTFSEEEKRFIDQPFPIIWASTSVESKGPLGNYDEYLVYGKAEWGSDIQLVFTPEEHVKELQDIVKPYGVNVLSFDAAAYLAGREPKPKSSNE